MSSPSDHIVDIRDWIARARRDPVAYVERQATEIVLTALGSIPRYKGRMFLKGGILMAIAYGSPRMTGDLDFTTDLLANPDFSETLRAELDAALPSAAAQLGYPDLVLRVQSCRERPRPFGSPGTSFPALEVHVGYAKRGSRAEQQLENKKAPEVIDVEISFNEPIHAIELIRFGTHGPEISAYGLTDIIAEKFRALLQQPLRNRYRRQDVYDIAHLVDRFPLDEHERAEILSTFLDKSRARNLTPDMDSISAPEITDRAKSEWMTLKQELGEIPDFDVCFAKVAALYKSLPWPASEAGQ